jgi:hypothetical protein
MAQSLLLEELGEEKSRLLIQELAEQELAMSFLVEEGVEWSVSEEEEEEEEDYADGWSVSEEEEEEEEEYEEESVDDEELEPDLEFDHGAQSSGYGRGCLLMCLRPCMLTHAC